MGYDLNKNVAFVASEGSYSANAEVLLFNASSLNDEQWDTLSILGDYEKMSYAQAILDGQDDLSEWES
jgi:hypothetical protein